MKISKNFRYIGFEDPKNEFEEFELENPLTYLSKCSMEDFEDLQEDIKVSEYFFYFLFFLQVYQRIEGKKNNEYWNDILIIIGSELKKLKDRRRAGMEETVHSSVQDEVLKIFKVCYWPRWSANMFNS